MGTMSVTRVKTSAGWVDLQQAGPTGYDTSPIGSAIYWTGTDGYANQIANLVKNPSFDNADYARWWWMAGDVSFSKVASFRRATGSALRMTPTNVGQVAMAHYGADELSRIPVTPGKSYRCAWFHKYAGAVPADPRTMNVMIGQQDAAGTAMANAFPNMESGLIIGATPTRAVTNIYTPAAGVAFFGPVIHVNADGTNEPIDIEDMMVVEGTPAELATMPDYVDGDMSGYAWSGTPHASTTVRSAIPDEWVLADGRRLTRFEYPDAYAFAKVQADAGNSLWTYRTSDETFTVPNFTDKFIYAKGAKALGANGGAETHALTEAELATHAHGVTDPTHGHGASYTGASDRGMATGGRNTGHQHQFWYDISSAVGTARGTIRNAGEGAYAAWVGGENVDHAHGGVTDHLHGPPTIYGAATGISVNNNGSGTAHNNMPPYVVSAIIVKVRGVAISNGAIVGPQGERGPQGHGVTMRGNVPTVDDLPKPWAQATNLLANGSFENGLTGWREYDHHQYQMDASTSTAQAFEGSTSALLTRIGTGSAPMSIETTPPVTAVAGRAYSLLYRARPATSARTLEPWLGFGENWIEGPLVAERVGEWQTVEMIAVAPAGSTSVFAWLGLQDCAEGEQHYFDAVILAEGRYANMRQGDAYIVQADDSFWMWDDTAWVSGGSIKGPKGDKGDLGGPANQVAQTYTITNAAVDRVMNASNVSINELANVLGTLINDMKTAGLIQP